ncbi:MAG: serine/threonine-protein kinase [Myxococcota bacterium]
MAVTYTFVRCLGRGGFGEVYLAVRRAPDGLERRVAVKVLRSDLPDGTLAMARLTDEARLLAILDHPSIVAAHELTRLHGRVALITEYIEGADLARFCSVHHRLPEKVIVSAVASVASALDCAYNTPSPETGKPLRMVHRDIKPENLRLSRHGEVKVLDFGIARSGELAREARTSSGNVPFTPGYTPPEAFVALKQEPPTDVFALGATVYRLLTAERFYEGIKVKDQAALSGAPDKYAAYLAERLAELPTSHLPIVRLVRSMLSYDPAERPTAAALQSTAELLSEALPGPTARRWAKETAWPEERALGEAPLLGMTMSEDRPGDSVIIDSRRLVPPPRPARSRPPAPERLHADRLERHAERPQPERFVAGPARSSGPFAGPQAAPIPWMPMMLGFASLSIGMVVLGVAAFAAGLIVGW